jgi:hypothetical protein
MNEDAIGERHGDAFHVTAAANMASIAAEGFRTDRRDVLGTGAYFDLDSDATGLAPARQRYPHQPLVVFRCEIAMGRVLDLDDEETRLRFQTFQRELIRRLGRDEGMQLGQGGHLDQSLDALAEMGENYDTVKRAFVTDGQTRIAVRDPQRIRVLSVRDEEGSELLWPPPSH